MGEIFGRNRLEETYHILDTDGSWQEIFLPSGVSALSMLIQVHEPTDIDLDPDTETFPFLYSHDETKGWTVVPKEGLYIDLRNSGRSVIPPESKIGKIKVGANYKVSITGAFKTTIIIENYEFEDGLNFEFEDALNFEFSN